MPNDEQQRQNAIRQRLVRSEARNREFLPTGFAVLDQALGGGFPRNSIVELFGPSSSGKSTLALEFVKQCQQDGGTAAWIDAEHAFDASYAVQAGVKLEAMPLVQPESAEQALEIVAKLAGSGAVDLLIVDSAAALVPRLELAAGLDGGEGLHARVLAWGLRKLKQAARRTGAVTVFLNQTRSRRLASGGDVEASAGGAPLKLYATVRLALDAPAGGRIPFRVLKNKAAGGIREGELRLTGGRRYTESP